MKIPDRLRSRIVAFSYDLCTIPVAWLGAYWLRFNLEPIPGPFLRQALWMLPLLLLIQGAVFRYFGLYRGVWRFASVPDLIRIIKAVVVGTALSAVAIAFLTRFAFVPRTVFPLYAILLLFLLGGARLLYRWIKDHSLHVAAGKKVLIVGAGRAGEMLARDLLGDPSQGYAPVAFVDDSLRKQGRDIHGLPVIGPSDIIPQAVRDHQVELILIAVPSANSRQMRRIVELCERSDVAFRTLPHIQDLVSGRVTLNELREVSIEDLLGREPVALDWTRIESGLRGKAVMVSGGGGSIGSELCRQLARLDVASLVVFERSEYNLYRIEQELRERFPALHLRGCLGDVCDRATVAHVMAEHRPAVIFHAAAYKHVPMLEYQLREAIHNNVTGTRLLAQAADQAGCETFVLISTDKAVNPTNVMGASKRCAEILCQNMNAQSQTRFITVRFGNVLGSAGSVVPLFRQQIADGGPVTVTHPDIIRYFMTTTEACQLIMQAGVLGTGGEIFVLDMGEPVRIAYLAEQMIRLSGRTPGEDIDIVYTGLRPGEKLQEELFHADENLTHTEYKQILLAGHRPVDWALLRDVLDNMEQASTDYDEATLSQLLHRLVPEFTAAPQPDADNVVYLSGAKN